MTEHSFKTGIAALTSAFPNSDKSRPETIELYWEMLKEIPDDIWHEGVKEHIRLGTFFPTVHDLGVACFGEQKETWEERFDPLRERQYYREKVPAESWVDRMADVLEERGIPRINMPVRPMIEGPKVVEINRQENMRLKKALDDVSRLKQEIQNLLDQRYDLLQRNRYLESKLAEPPKPKITVEERRAILKKQFEELMAKEKSDGQEEGDQKPVSRRSRVRSKGRPSST